MYELETTAREATSLHPASGDGIERARRTMGFSRAFLREWLRRLSPRDPASGLPSVNQGGGAAGAMQGVGTGVAGTGAGLLGAGVLAGLLGINCIGAPILLPAGAALGLLSALGAGWILISQGDDRFTAHANGNLNVDDVSSTFELIGQVNADGSVTGSAGMYRSKDLE